MKYYAKKSVSPGFLALFTTFWNLAIINLPCTLSEYYNLQYRVAFQVKCKPYVRRKTTVLLAAVNLSQGCNTKDKKIRRPTFFVGLWSKSFTVIIHKAIKPLCLKQAHNFIHMSINEQSKPKRIQFRRI